MSFYFEFSLVLVNIRYFSFCFSCLFWVSVQNISSLCPGDEAIITRAAPQSKKTQGKELYAGAPLPIRKNQQTLSLLVKFKLNWNEWMYGKVSLVGWLAVSSCNSLSLSLSQYLYCFTHRCCISNKMNEECSLRIKPLPNKVNLPNIDTFTHTHKLRIYARFVVEIHVGCILLEQHLRRVWDNIATANAPCKTCTSIEFFRCINYTMIGIVDIMNKIVNTTIKFIEVIVLIEYIIINHTYKGLVRGNLFQFKRSAE